MKELVKKEETTWTSKKELMNNLQISPDTIEQIISDLTCRRPADTQNHIKKGGYHNSEVFYDDYLINMITAELAKHILFSIVISVSLIYKATHFE